MRHYVVAMDNKFPLSVQEMHFVAMVQFVRSW